MLRCIDLRLGASTGQLYSWLSSDDVRDQSLPRVVEADLVEFTADDEAVFPDESNIDAAGDKSLTIRLEETIDANETLLVERRAHGARRRIKVRGAEFCRLSSPMVRFAALLDQEGGK